MSATAYFVGLDLGQAQDFTALAVLERPRRPEGRPGYACRHLRRFPLGTPYPEVVRGVGELLGRPELRGCDLVVDQTGVGRAVVEMLAESLEALGRECLLWAVTITAGSQAAAGEAPNELRVPKKDLVGVMQVLLSGRRIQIARALPEAETLARELEAFRVKVRPDTGHESFEAWRERDHDDLVLAVALAAWLGELALPPRQDAGGSYPLDRDRYPAWA